MSLPRDVEPLAVPPGSDYGMSHAVETAAAHGPTNPWVALAYLVAGVFFILALRGLSSPATSRAGNRNGMIGMLIAVVTVIVTHDIANIVEILINVVKQALGPLFRARSSKWAGLRSSLLQIFDICTFCRAQIPGGTKRVYLSPAAFLGVLLDSSASTGKFYIYLYKKSLQIFKTKKVRAF